jgi:RNA polymerase sporulation-specific sigma factor
LARAKGRAFFLAGADANDVEQEGLIALFKAARDFRPDRTASFKAFAELCVNRHVITAIRAAARRKHQPLNSYISVSPCGPEDQDQSADKLLGPDPSGDPAEEVGSKERLDDARRRVTEALTVLETDVLSMHLGGYSYQEISDRVGRHVKSIDNSLQRIRRKLKRLEDQGLTLGV